MDLPCFVGIIFMLSLREAVIIRGEKKGESEGENAVHLWFTSSSLGWVTDEESDWVVSKDRLRLLRQMSYTPQPPS